MHLRHDALAAAAEWITSVEALALKTEGLVATVGKIEAHPNAGNVVAGSTNLSLDIRHAMTRRAKRRSTSCCNKPNPLPIAADSSSNGRRRWTSHPSPWMNA